LWQPRIIFKQLAVKMWQISSIAGGKNSFSSQMAPNQLEIFAKALWWQSVHHFE